MNEDNYNNYNNHNNYKNYNTNYNYNYNSNYVNNQNNYPYNTIYNGNSFYNNYNNDSNKNKKNTKKILTIIFCSLIIIAIAIFAYFTFFKNSNDKKNRTFMIYMVGSDLESKSKQGTYSISNIVGENIDLENNNIILIAGGAKKWHNFVDVNEIGIYELTKYGFAKKSKLPVDSMGSSIVLENFLKYSYNNYPAEKYDLIFWNHGLGAIGIEQDELSKDYLTLNELNNALNDSPFSKEKLELTIFNNCLSSNIHVANIMKNYSDYMVASEEVLYLSKVLNRLNFLEKVQEDDTGFDVGHLYIEQSDKVVKEYNLTHSQKIDSTLSIIDLSKIDKLNKTLNDFIKTIDITRNYYDISSIRRRLHTYGIVQTNDYDTIDLYGLVEAFGRITNDNNLKDTLLEDINNAHVYTSNFNDYSNGISIYFPYYGSKTAVEKHLSLFEKIANDDYFSFINYFYEIRNGFRRSGKENVQLLTNEPKKDENSISIQLTEKEKKSYQDANIYIFSKNGDFYELLLSSTDVKLDNNKLVFDNKNNMLLTVDNKPVSYINKNNNKIVFGMLEDSSDQLKTKFVIDEKEINETVLDSEDYISSGLIDYKEYKEIYFSKLKYKIFEDGKIQEDWKENFEKEKIKLNKTNSFNFINNNKEEYYVLFELIDINNESTYSKLTRIGV